METSWSGKFLEPVKVTLARTPSNRGYGAIKATQTNLFNGHLVACDENSNLSLPAVAKIADAYGVKTFTISDNTELENKVKDVLSWDGPVVCEVMTPIGLTAFPKQISYKTSDGQMESKPLEYMNPPISDEEMAANMLIPVFVER